MDVYQVIAEMMSGADFFSKKPVTQRAYKAKVKRLLERAGYAPVKAKYDNAGNCVYCGEAGRCPGWHTNQEVKKLPDISQEDARELVDALKQYRKAVGDYFKARNISDGPVAEAWERATAAIKKAKGV